MTNPADTPLPLPQSGGSYIRLADGSLVLEGPEAAQPEPAKPGRSEERRVGKEC